MTKRMDKFIPIMKDQGIAHVCAAGKAGLGIQSFRITSGGSPDVVTFASIAGAVDMASASYQVICQGETAARVKVDESTITAQGFSILGGAAAEIIHVIVIGQLKGQQA